MTKFSKKSPKNREKPSFSLFLLLKEDTYTKRVVDKRHSIKSFPITLLNTFHTMIFFYNIIRNNYIFILTFT